MPTSDESIVQLAQQVEAKRQAYRRGHQKGNGHDKAPAIALKLTGKGTPRALVFNVLQILRKDARWQGVLGYDQFAERAMLQQRPPYDRNTGDWIVRPLEDFDDIEAAAWLQCEFDVPVQSQLVSEAIQVAARDHRYHPVRDYLNALSWDKTPRLDTWLIDHFGVLDSAYARAVSSKALIAAVARIYQPGCKADSVLILDGQQGWLKSTVWRILAGDDWFTDHMPDLHSKDAMQQLAGKWIIELAELSSLSRSDIESVKRFLSAVQDDFRPAYGRHRISLPRRCIFVGTTNETCYLKDCTGNRRFWPLSLTRRGDIARLRADRDQLWAEAVERFNRGERWHLSGEIEQQAQKEQAARLEIDDWEAPILAYLETRPELNKVTAGELMEAALGLDNKRDWTQAHSRRVNAILRKNGWKQGVYRVEGHSKKSFLRPLKVNVDASTATTSDNHANSGGNAKNANNINNVTTATTATTTTIYKEDKYISYYSNRESGARSGSVVAALKNQGLVDSASGRNTALLPVDMANGSGNKAESYKKAAEFRRNVSDEHANNMQRITHPAASAKEIEGSMSDKHANNMQRVTHSAGLSVTATASGNSIFDAPSCRHCVHLAALSHTCKALLIYADPHLEPPCNGRHFKPSENLP